ncbi:MAG: DinB family protein [Bacteroidota bacterium]
METFFNQLFDYNFYCNKSLITKVKEIKDVPDQSVTFFSHILNAHHIWNSRLIKEESTYDVWEIHKIKDWEEIHYENQRATFEVIRNTEDFNTRIEYETTSGRTFTNEIKDILFHIINHSTHHRGQIVMDFRQHGIELQALDYIFYRR